MLELGGYHLSALKRTEETKVLIGSFQPAQDNLRNAVMGLAEAETVWKEAAVGVIFTEDALEHAIRDVALRAHAEDNNATTGAAYRALFADGLEAVLRPAGASQAEVALALRGRLDTQPAAAKVKAQVMDTLDTSIAAFKVALDERVSADGKVKQARDTEAGARERFIAAYDSNMGAIRQMFPRNRKRQDMFFDTISSKRSSSNNSAGNTPPIPTPADNKEQK
jgi:hypothetical protein